MLLKVVKEQGLKIFAPSFEAAQIATSRAFSKKFLYKNHIPTTKYGVFDKEQTAIDYINKSTFPLFVKYDHLAHEDSFLCTSFNKAKNTISKVFEEVQKKVIVEDFVEGEIITFSILTDGYNVLPLPYVKEYKRVLDGNGGAFTKGVGAYTPFNKVSEELENKIAIYKNMSPSEIEKMRINAFSTINDKWNTRVAAQRLHHILKSLINNKIEFFDDGPFSNGGLKQ